MESDTTRSTFLYDILAWLEVNKTSLVIGAVIVAVVVTGVSAVVHFRNQKESRASEALADLFAKPLTSATAWLAGSDEYMKLAQTYAGTRAAGRAALLAATALVTEGKPAEGQAQFEKFLKDYGSSPWTVQAEYGIAAALQAQGKNAEAGGKFDEIIKRYPNDPLVDDAKLGRALALLAQNKPEEAHPILDDLTKSPTSSFGIVSEAGERLRALVKQFPHLAKTNAPDASTVIPIGLPTNFPAASPTGSIVLPVPSQLPAPGSTASPDPVSLPRPADPVKP